MPAEPNKLTSCIPRLPEILNSGNKRSDKSIFSMMVDPESLFRRDVPRPHLRKEESLDAMFQTLLTEANRELASLLQDVSKETHGTVFGGTRSQQLSELLARAVRYAAKHYILLAELGSLALTDDLTGSYNRRGFQVLAERQLKLVRRAGRGMLLFFIDVDGLKHINDSFGHAEGDQILRRTAETLERTFRDSDVIARIGGDEFAVLAIEASGRSEATIRTRLCKYLSKINRAEGRYAISLSVGVARFEPGSRAPLTDLMAEADHAMYEVKRGRSRPILLATAPKP